ncbi:TPA_asm: hypothetical protein [Porphyromonas phage phage023a_KCOM2797]|uniref:Lipoprotein n=1 Tax=Porphyromonas phage phage023a_KCOM2797 TaxID=3154113 RepID=A0AAT9J8U3_9CAUD
MGLFSSFIWTLTFLCLRLWCYKIVVVSTSQGKRSICSTTFGHFLCPYDNGGCLYVR